MDVSLHSAAASQTGTAPGPDSSLEKDMLVNAERSALKIVALLEQVQIIAGPSFASMDWPVRNRMSWLVQMAADLSRSLREQLEELFTVAPDQARKLGPRLAALLDCFVRVWGELDGEEEAQHGHIVLEVCRETAAELSESLSRATLQ